MAFKQKIYPGMLAALIGAIAAFLLLQLRFVWTQSLTKAPPSPSVPVVQIEKPQQTPSQPAPVANGLRVSNQSTYPVRVVLLPRHSESSSQKYREPVHWDFAPSEGSQEGLILSLPDGNLRLQQGDILMAFALDGSRRYWGPYSVGETAAPVRSSQSGEWNLTLRP
jgi:hypothetical protein